MGRVGSRRGGPPVAHNLDAHGGKLSWTNTKLQQAVRDELGADSNDDQIEVTVSVNNYGVLTLRAVRGLLVEPLSAELTQCLARDGHGGAPGH
jgi:hypothetical protein